MPVSRKKMFEFGSLNKKNIFPQFENKQYLQLPICPIGEILMTPRESLIFNKRKTTLEGNQFLHLDFLCVKWIASLQQMKTTWKP